MFSATVGQVNIAIEGVETFRASAAGVSVVPLGTAAAPSIFRTNDPDTGIFFRTSNEFSVAAGGAEIQRNTSAGVDIRTGDLLRGGTKVVGARVINAALGNTANSGDANTDALIEALKAVITTHGLGAAS
jgi:hypothetical protein